ncbi:hypothetical protein [Nocardioides lijunqiniae]|uniref:hypothetical protein n=1 Tax=Nocardioides lijunqiniae TaxID=2760832 RepID=UPI0018775DFE|nr:hypothetical protein [Nocardioides lijunqiniae]
MTTYPVLRFVAAPSPDAAVRLDLHAYTAYTGVRIWPVKNGWSIGTPAMEGEPDGVGVEYGPRTLGFDLRVEGSKVHALAKHSQIAREILRDGNWLLFQLSASTEPVWFHTYRTEPGELSFEHVTSRGDADRWGIGMKLTAEPFALGKRVVMPPVTITNDPTAGPHRMSCLLPEILGDAPSPVRIQADFTTTLDQHDIEWTIAPVPDDYEPLVWPIGVGDTFTAGTDTGPGTPGAAFAGESYRPVTFDTDEDLVTRLYGPAPGPVPPGRYRIHLRVGRTHQDSTYELRLGRHNGVFGDDASGADTVTLHPSTTGAGGATDATWVELGTMSFPANLTEIDLVGFNFTPSIALQIGRTAGTGDLNLDCMVLVPVDIQGTEGVATTLTSEFAGFGPQAADSYSVWDGDVEAYTRMNGFGVIDSGLQPVNRGGFPTVHPGVTNALHLITQTRTTRGFFDTTNGDSRTTTTDVTLSYHPRHLWIGDR